MQKRCLVVGDAGISREMMGGGSETKETMHKSGLLGVNPCTEMTPIPCAHDRSTALPSLRKKHPVGGVSRALLMRDAASALPDVCESFGMKAVVDYGDTDSVFFRIVEFDPSALGVPIGDALALVEKEMNALLLCKKPSAVDGCPADSSESNRVNPDVGKRSVAQYEKDLLALYHRLVHPQQQREGDAQTVWSRARLYEMHDALDVAEREMEAKKHELRETRRQKAVYQDAVGMLHKDLLEIYQKLIRPLNVQNEDSALWCVEKYNEIRSALDADVRIYGNLQAELRNVRGELQATQEKLQETEAKLTMSAAHRTTDAQEIKRLHERLQDCDTSAAAQREVQNILDDKVHMSAKKIEELEAQCAALKKEKGNLNADLFSAKNFATIMRADAESHKDVLLSVYRKVVGVETSEDAKWTTDLSGELHLAVDAKLEGYENLQSILREKDGAIEEAQQRQRDAESEVARLNEELNARVAEHQVQHKAQEKALLEMRSKSALREAVVELYRDQLFEVYRTVVCKPTPSGAEWNTNLFVELKHSIKEKLESVHENADELKLKQQYLNATLLDVERLKEKLAAKDAALEASKQQMAELLRKSEQPTLGERLQKLQRDIFAAVRACAQFDNDDCHSRMGTLLLDAVLNKVDTAMERREGHVSNLFTLGLSEKCDKHGIEFAKTFCYTPEGKSTLLVAKVPERGGAN